MRISEFGMRNVKTKSQKSALNTRHDAILVMMLFSGVTDVRALCFCDLYVEKTAAHACGRMRRGQRMPPQVSHLKHKPVRLGTKEKASLPIRMSCSLSIYYYLSTPKSPFRIRFILSQRRVMRFCGLSLRRAMASACFVPMSTTSSFARVTPVYIRFL